MNVNDLIGELQQFEPTLEVGFWNLPGLKIQFVRKSFILIKNVKK